MLFKNHQAHEDRATLEKYAQQLGLNMGKFKAALDAQKVKEADEAEGRGQQDRRARHAGLLHQRQVPLGRAAVRDLQGQDRRRDEAADALIAKGTPKAELYDAMMKDAKTEIPAAPAPPRSRALEEPEDTTVYKVSAATARQGVEDGAAAGGDLLRLPVPVLHARRADSDAARKGVRRQGAPGLEELSAPFHNNADAGRRGGHGRQRAGKFWEMHDKLFENQQALDRANLEKYAQQIGLNLNKFKADLDSGSSRAGSSPTPKRARRRHEARPVFINGHKINGAYPFEAFKKIADDELKKKKG